MCYEAEDCSSAPGTYIKTDAVAHNSKIGAKKVERGRRIRGAHWPASLVQLGDQGNVRPLKGGG